MRVIDIGTAPNDKTGDPLRDAFDKCNDNFVEVLDILAGGTTATVAFADITALQAGMSLIGNYASLTAAVATIGSTQRTLLINAATTITANTVIPATLSIVVTNTGAINHGAYTLTINGTFFAGMYDVFSGSGLVEFGLNAPSGISPHWFGAIGDGIVDDAAAINKAIDAVGDGGGLLFGVGKNYLLQGKIVFANKKNITVNGNGSTLTEAPDYYGYGDYGHLSKNGVVFFSGCENIIFRNFKTEGNRLLQTTVVVFMVLTDNKNIKCEMNLFANEKHHVMWLAENNTEIVVSDNEFYNNFGGLTGADIYSSSALNFGTFKNNYFHRDLGVLDEAGGDTQSFYISKGNFEMLNNRFYGVGCPYDFREGNHTVRGGSSVRTENVLLMVTTTDAVVHFSDFTATEVINNTVGGGAAIYQIQGKLTISDVSITSDTTDPILYGVRVRQNGSSIPKQSSITNVTVNGATTTGFFVENVATAPILIYNCSIDTSSHGVTTNGGSQPVIVKDCIGVNLSSTFYHDLDGMQRKHSDRTGTLSDIKGTATFSGNGTTARFDITHGLGFTPTEFFVTPNTAAAAGPFYATVTSTTLSVWFPTAPVNGTNNVVLKWRAER